jgi:uncharacterized protein DUF3618
MAETTADVRRDIELTRERMSSTIEELEQKLNVKQMVRDHPWPAIAIAFGAGIVLSGSKADVKAAAATALATKGATSKIGAALDDVIASLLTSVTQGLHGHVDNLASQIKGAMGARQNRPSQGGYGVGPVDVPAPVNPLSAKDVTRAD